MNQLIIRIAVAAIGVSIAGTGAVIYSRDSAPEEVVVSTESISVDAAEELRASVEEDGGNTNTAIGTGTSTDAGAGVILNVGTDVRVVQSQRVGDVLVKSSTSGAGDSGAGSQFTDNSALIERLGVEIDAFLGTRQEARDENPLPELIVWLESRSEIEDVAVTENSGEIYIVFKGGGATVLRIGK